MHRIVAHLCEASTQQRLREQAHVRDGIVAEFRLVLGADVVTEELTRRTNGRAAGGERSAG